ncbi:MAG: ATP-binding protein [Elusimicrobia bacterium]|nr:ATP-binding protein [Elusimicrobiota bacterium]
MLDRKIEKDLQEWKLRGDRKPLVLRGARQTGKTTLARKFAKQFEIFVELNIEKDPIKRIFAEVKDIKDVLQSIEGISNRRIIPGKTLLFLDEIQNSVPAIKMLRFFHEETPGLHVIAAGSLLEVRMKREGWSFPVGRVEFLYLYPVSFDEFLRALGQDILLRMLMELRAGQAAPAPVHDKLEVLVLEYMAVGGMPEAVSRYIAGGIADARRCHEALSSSFKEDFGKYAAAAGVEQLRAVWDRTPFTTGARINYSRLAGAVSRSRDVSKAFEILHEAMLVERIFPTSVIAPPLVEKFKTAPKAQYLDIGLCTHALNLTREHIRDRLVASNFSGGLFEAFAGQELLAIDSRRRLPLFFWTREEKGACSELDFLVLAGGRIIPIEVKSGSHGSLKSLHQFLHRSRSELGVRIYNGPLKLDRHEVKLPDGKALRYKLLSVPCYLMFRLFELLQGPVGIRS